MVSRRPTSESPRIALAGTGHSTRPRSRNAALAALSADALALLEPHLRQRFFEERNVLWECGEVTGRVYFPISGIISIALPVGDGNGAEVAHVGREGGAGMDYSPEQRSPTQGIVQVSGTISIMSASQFASAAAQSREVGLLMECCRDWLVLQAQQAAACNAVHTAEQRFSRWLLQCCEHTESTVAPLTQDVIAQVLGLRRTTVTLIAQGLQAAGVISYTRGRIVVHDPSGLRSAACDCWSALDRTHWPSQRLTAGQTPEDN